LTIAERKEREKQQRREEIIDAAEKVFFSKGIDQSTMDDVAQAAELSKGTLYLYFKSKSDLYLAINLRGLAILEDLFKKALIDKDKGLQQVEAIGRAYHYFYQEYNNYFNALLYYELQVFNESNDNTVMQACDCQGHKSLEVLIDAIQNGIADRSIQPDIDPLKTATVLWGHVTGILQLISSKGNHLEKDHKMNMDEIVEYSFKMLVSGLKNRSDNVS